MKTPLTTKTARWRRMVVALAGIAILGMLGGGFLLIVAVAGHPGPGNLLLIFLSIVASLLATLLLTAGLLADPTQREVEDRLRDLEDRITSLEGLRTPPELVGPAPEKPETPVSPPADRTTEPPIPRPETLARPPLQPPSPAPPAVPVPPPAVPPAASPSSPAAEGWELALGRRWLGRIGAVVLVVAVALFLKLGWDQGWLRPSETARVLLGLALGAALLAAGELTRRRGAYPAQAQALGAAGLGTAVLSLWAAATLFHLVPPIAGLVLLAAMGGLVATYAIAISGEVLAVLATAAGFMAPFLVPETPWNVPAVLCLACAFSAAALAAGLARRWSSLAVTAALGTALDLAAVLDVLPESNATRLAWAWGVLAVTIVHLAASFLAARRSVETPGIRLFQGAAAAGAFAAWGAGTLLLQPVSDHAAAAWSAGVILLLAATALAARNAPGGKTLAGMLGTVAWLPAVTLPGLLLDGTAVGLAWAALAFAAGLAGLLSGRSGWLLGSASLAVLAAIQPFVAAETPTTPGALRVLGLAALLTALLAVSDRLPSRGSSGNHRILRTLAGPASGAALFALALFASTPIARFLGTPGPAARLETLIRLGILLAGGTVLAVVSAARTSPMTIATAAILAFVGLFPVKGPPPDLRPAAFLPAARIALAGLSALLVALAAGADGTDRWRRRLAWGTALAAALLALPMARANWLEHTNPAAGLIRPALLATAAILLLVAGRRAARWSGLPAGWIENAGWFVLVISASRAVTVPFRSGPVLSILWGLAGLALVGAGLATRTAHRRHVGLLLLALTLARIFLRDLSGASTLVRVVAFAVTGAALIAGSFLYARFRDLFSQETAPDPAAGSGETEESDAW